MKRIYLIIVYIVLFLFGTAFAQTSSREAFSRMFQLREQGKIPAYVIERGTYKYFDNIRVAYVKGKNVFMRSQPQKIARIVTKLSNVELEYLGEWTHPISGEKWICVKRKTYDEIGWIYGEYIELLKETSAGSKQMHSVSNVDREGYKKDKDCTEEPCGFLGGLLFISPILWLIEKINKSGPKVDLREGSKTHSNHEEYTHKKIEANWLQINKWVYYGPDKDFYEFLRTTDSSVDVINVFQYIDLSKNPIAAAEAACAAQENPNGLMSILISKLVHDASKP